MKARARRAAWCSLAVAIGLAGLSRPAVAQPRDAMSLPPLIDREIFFGDPEIAGAQISPDGSSISFLKPYQGTRNIWVKGVDEPFDKARPITAETKRPISSYFWSRDSRFVLFVQDQGGDENFNVHAVDPRAAKAAGQGVPPSRNLTNVSGARAFIYHVPKSDPDTIYVGLNDRDQAWHDLYTVKLSTGERTLVRKNTERLVGWVFDTKDQLRMAVRAADNGDTEVLRVDADAFVKVLSCGVLETCDPIRFHKDGARVYLQSNRGQADLVGLTLMDVQNGREEPVERDPQGRVDLGSAIFSDVTNDLIATAYVDDRVRFDWKDQAFKADYEFVQQQLGNKQINFGSHTTDERLWILSATSDVEPGQTYLFDRRARKLTLQYRIRERLPRESLAEMTALRYPSSDGLEVPAYLTLPKGVAPKNLPLVVFPHGGPWARDTWGYDAEAQFLANRGYAVLQSNFRGSVGYGKKFLDAGNGEWGQKMQDDLTWGVKHLIAKGIADPKRVGIMGGSYGGYATLAGLAFTPDVYAAGVSIVGPSNLITLLGSIPPYWEAGRTLFNVRMGDPSKAEGKALLEKQSPLNSADRIRTPLMVVQGANDPRVKKAESDQIVVALRDRGFPVEYIVAPDEGHGFARPVNNMAMYAAAEKFLSRHLEGRFQESMTPEVASRLREIRVDPATVEKPKPATAATVAVPKVAATLAPGEARYAGRVELPDGQKMTFTTARQIEKTAEGFVVTERAQLPMGEATDRTLLAGESLIVLKRSIAQGPITINFTVAEGRARGEMTVSGQPKPIDVALEGDLFADGAGAHLVVGALPLAAGYQTAFRNLDVQTQAVKVMELKVVGEESVTVPAGTFDAWKVEIAGRGETDKTTLWVAKQDRELVKASAIASRMNGAVITTELQK